MAHWTAVFRERGAELSEAIASWQTRHHLAAVLSTGFLDGSHPIVDAYELGVRLQHMLRRLTALAAGAMVQAPLCVLPGLWLGNAVAADSHHLLQYLGVTHVVNAAQELPLESAPGLFQVHRVAIRDEEEEDVAAHFQQVQVWIDAALGGGGGVLVHCHEGKSRSVALLLAYLMISKGHTLAAALAHIRSVRPEACPNAGFMVQLIALDRQLHGSASLSRADLPRAKPEARICSICGAAAGLSYASLVRHMKTKHKAAGAAAVAAAKGASSGGGTGRSAGGAAVVAAVGGKTAMAAGLPPLAR
ncbi:protein-tyrosine phosphatase-like protein [Scenedesmus sp. NREL 46B-D3]|nr:protein-tyrosine phosphatase-like protein [Scenedesmus sp. NREL 46B-D3]